MRIAVIGSGAVGLLYGSRLARAGHDVRFLMRRDLEAVRQHGLTVESRDGDFHLDKVQAFGDPREIGPVDLVICSLKTTSLDEAERLIRPCVGPGTEILCLMNGFNIEPRFGRWFGRERILGGLAFVCSNRGQPGVLHHLDYGRVVFGHLLDNRAKAERMAALFTEAGFETRVAPSLLQARYEKLFWNVPFNTICVTAGAVTTREILGDAGLSATARVLMHEVGSLAKADGCGIDMQAFSDRMMSDTGTMGPYRPSMLIDYELKRPLEVEAILGEPVRRAARLAIPVPTMESQYHLLSFLDRRNRGEVAVEKPDAQR
ncbi:MAG TPA: 2-dehydropantoate 2-reductase [Phycisphaerae bacterium]|nr:2-dehydropantoate 2-reductase [Phycisphaerae bacterium]